RPQVVGRVAAVEVVGRVLETERAAGARAGEVVTETEAAQDGPGDDEEDGWAARRPRSAGWPRNSLPRTRRARPGTDAAGPPGSTPRCAARCRCCWSSWCWSVRPSAG